MADGDREPAGGAAPGRRRCRGRCCGSTACRSRPIADAFEDLGGDGGGTETTICASALGDRGRDPAPDGAGPAAEQLAGGLRERFGRAVFSEGPATLEELVLELLRGQGRTLATAESCTAGLVASRLAGVAGASDVLSAG